MQARAVSAALGLTCALLLSALPASAVAPDAGTAHRALDSLPSSAPASGPARGPATPLVVTPTATKDAAATLTVSSSASGGTITLLARSNGTSVQVKYRDASGSRSSATEELADGQAQISLPPGSSSIRVRARATATLTASPWVAVSDAPGPSVPTPGATYRISPSSRILGTLARYRTVNKHTRDYYLIRSYMQRFEAAGGGTLILGPGRYVISSTIYVPSNTTIRLSEGTTLVKGNRTGTKKFSASNAMFMLIRPSLGKKKGAVGGHDGASGITIAGAGGGRSVIDLANVRDALAIISGHNRDVTISGITFTQMNNNHFIEMDGCADCEISGNEFLDAADGTRDTAEAINLDTPDPRTRGFGSIWSKQDGTPNVRVTISRNRFDGMERALGTHNFTAGAYHTDITVIGNTITSNADDAIHIMNWANPVFSGNTISSSAGSVGIRACGTINPTITGNTFEGSAAALVFRDCSGENGRTSANEVTDDAAADLQSNLVGAGLARASVGVPGQGSVTLSDSETPPGVPSQPLVESVVAGDRQVTARWAPSVADDRAPITAYRIHLRTEGDDDPDLTVDAPAGATEAGVSGLVNGTTYTVTVASVNSAGESPTGAWSASTVTPEGPPTVPLEAAGGSRTIGLVGLSWKPPADDGGRPITAYRVHIFADPAAGEPLPGSPVELHPDTAKHEWAGLTEGATYYVRVAAVNSLGEGPASELVEVLVKPTPAAVQPRM